MSKPIKSIKLGKCEIAVFQNEIMRAEDKHPIVSFSYVVKKNYFDENSKEWKATSNFNRAELLQLLPLIPKIINSVEGKEIE